MQVYNSHSHLVAADKTQHGLYINNIPRGVPVALFLTDRRISEILTKQKPKRPVTPFMYVRPTPASARQTPGVERGKDTALNGQGQIKVLVCHDFSFVHISAHRQGWLKVRHGQRTIFGQTVFYETLTSPTPCLKVWHGGCRGARREIACGAHLPLPAGRNVEKPKKGWRLRAKSLHLCDFAEESAASKAAIN